MKTISFSAYAKEKGVSKQYVSKLAKQGKLNIVLEGSRAVILLPTLE